MNLFAKLILAFCAAAVLCSGLGLAIYWQAAQAANALGTDAPAALLLAEQLALGLTILPFACALVLGVALSRTFGRRLARLAAGARAFGEGRLDHRIADGSADEVGALARVLDEMAERLADSPLARDHAEAILDSVADPLCVLDADGHVTCVNCAAAALVDRTDHPLPTGVTVAFPALLAAVDADANLYASIAADARDNIADENAALKDALQADDLVASARHAHTIKTLAALLGATRLHDLAAGVQHAADSGSLVGAVQAYLPMHAETKDSLARLDAELLPHGAVPAVDA